MTTDVEELSTAALADLLRKHAFHSREVIIEVVDRLEEYEYIADIRWAADMRAIKRWQKAHPGNDLLWPDHGDLTVWLMEQLDGMRKIIDGHDAA